MFSKFFIDRPIFASVLSIVITLAGGIALKSLPIAMYPQISPPTVQVDCNYAGASAQVVSESVATPIEQQVNGVENMLYMSSQCTNDGTYNLTVTFKHGVDLNMAQVLVQNRVSLALPMLPDVLKQTGVNVKKKSPDILLAIAINSPDNTRDQLYLSNYATLQVKDELSRMPGVSDVMMLGQRDYSMRIWVDPDKLAARGLTASDVTASIREQNMQVASGQIGQAPAPEGQAIQVPLTTLGRLSEVEQFERIIVRRGQDGRFVRIKDVARVELGAKNQDMNCVVNGKPSISLAIFQLPDANALDAADALKARMEELKKDFPPGVDYEIRYDTTPFIRESIDEVFKTLREAIILVAIVVLLFLQNWRSAVIPLVAVPVAIIGTFAAMAAFGFSLNNLTLFGLVLAIGIVVDDAIVVVEAVEHHIEHGMAPRDATVKAMEEVSGPVIAIGLVLTAVFVPCAFISGIVGQFFRQFALTIAVSTVISAFNSLTLSPALAALLLKARRHGEGHGVALPRVAYMVGGGLWGYLQLAPYALEFLKASRSRIETLGVDGAGWSSALLVRLQSLGEDRTWWVATVAATALGLLGGWLAGPPIDRLLTGFFRLFNAGFRMATSVYGKVIGGLLRVSFLVLICYGGLLWMTYRGFLTTATGFIPSQDMGYLLINAQLPDSASLERSQEVMNRLEEVARLVPGIKHTQTMTGQSLLLSANGSNFGSMFLILDSFANRRHPELYTGIDPVTKKPRQFELSKARRLKGLVLPPGKDVAYPWYQDVEKDGKVEEKKLTVEDLSGDSIQAELRKRFEVEVPGAMITVLGPPPVRGVGRAGGFKLMVEDRGDFGPQTLQKETESLVANARDEPAPSAWRGDETPEEIRSISERPGIKRTLDGSETPDELKTKVRKALAGQFPGFVGLTSVFRANVPQLYFEANRTETLIKEVPIRELFDTIRIFLGSLYVNDINLFGRTWQVVVQADHQFRERAEDVGRLKVRNVDGKMVPLGTVAYVREERGPLVLTRYNMYPAAPLNGAAAPGVSSGEAIRLLDEISKKVLLPQNATEWTELAFLEIQAGNTAMYVFAFAVVMVFLVLAAQYESWSLPLAIILVVPMCLLSALVGVWLGKQDVNIFTQIGFVVLVGLASKNAILIVEFAKQRRDEGETPRQSALDACMLRLRPIIMTSMAFILGVLPLMVSHGAGAEMRRTLGTTVFSGMLGVTLFGIFFTPVFFYVIDVLGETSFFRSPLIRAIGRVSIGIVSLRYVREAAVRSLSRPGSGKAATTIRELEPEPAREGELVEHK